MANGQSVTRFKIKDPIKGLTGQFTTINVTVFQDLPLQDTKQIKLLDYDNLIFSYYEKTKKINVFVSAIIEIIPTSGMVNTPKVDINNPYAED